ncbi:MAG: lipoate--protein ligase family protein [Candidatus Gastranaerophilales bacterium]|nr:lipoate--protein ligase family protein [Candidatus Gastranaerophilales bacterium]
MQIDENLLNLAIEENSQESILRMYGWSSPTVSIGKNQTLDGINLDFCKKNKIPIVKRPTGGRALLHDKELTYCFIVPCENLQKGRSVIESYKEISGVLIESFSEIGIKLDYPQAKKISPAKSYCMSVSTGADLSYKGQKLIGSAQLRRRDYILQHGSILIDIDREMIKKIFDTQNIFENVTTLKDIKANFSDMFVLEKIIAKNFKKYF